MPGSFCVAPGDVCSRLAAAAPPLSVVKFAVISAPAALGLLLAGLLLLAAAPFNFVSAATPDGGSEDTLPFFIDPQTIPEQIYKVGEAIPTIQFPRAAGGNGALKYSVSIIDGAYCIPEGSSQTGPAVEHQGSGSALTEPKAAAAFTAADWDSYFPRDWMSYTPPLDTDNHGGTLGPTRTKPSPQHDNWRAPEEAETGCIILLVEDSDPPGRRYDAAEFAVNFSVIDEEAQRAAPRLGGTVRLTPEELAKAAHPEIYENPDYGLTAACSEVEEESAKITFALGGYTGPPILSLSLWDGRNYLSYRAHGLAMPELQRDNGTAYVEISTLPPKTRFRLDTPEGRNLVLGYGDCHYDLPPLDEDGNPPPPPPKTAEERAAEINLEIYERALDGGDDDNPMTVFCEVGEGRATLTFGLSSYTGAVALSLSQWDGVGFRSFASLGRAFPPWQRDGQIATVEIATHTPARVRFRLDSQYGRNLLLGYADCHYDAPPPPEETDEPEPESTAATLPASAAAAHPEVYANGQWAMSAACTGVTEAGATITFNLGRYTRPVTLALSRWDGTAFRSYEAQDLPRPELQRDGHQATVTLTTNPALTRFRIDTAQNANLLLGYANCSTDDPAE